MDAGQLYGLAKNLKAFAEQSLGATANETDTFPPSQQLVLGQVLAEPGISITELAVRLQLAQSAVSSAVAALREQGLLSIEASTADRRRVHVLPSERLRIWAGTSLTRDLSDILTPLLAGLKESDRRCVLRALPLLAQALDHHNEAN